MKKCAENERKAVPKCFLHCRKKGSEMGAERERERGGEALKRSRKVCNTLGFSVGSQKNVAQKCGHTAGQREKESERDAVREREREGTACLATPPSSAAPIIYAYAVRRSLAPMQHGGRDTWLVTAQLIYAASPSGRERERRWAGDSCRLPGSLICSAHTEHMIHGQVLKQFATMLGANLWVQNLY